VTRNALIAANLDTGAVNEADACAPAETSAQISAQWNEGGGKPFNETTVANQSRKSVAPEKTNVVEIEIFESAVALLMKSDQDGHDFAQGEGARALTLREGVGKELLMPERLKSLAKIVDVAKESF